MAKNTGKNELTDDQAEQILFDAMCLYGMLSPSVDEVAAIDAELASLKLPFGPSDPNKLLERLDTENVEKDTVILSFSSLDTTCVSNLARAAREGSELTAEIEQRMATDKAKYLQDEHQ